MPTTSAKAAQKWISEQAATKPVPADTTTLTAAKLEKLKLETALLAVRLQREQANVEFLPAAASVATVKLAFRFALIALKARAEEFAEPLAATTTPQQAIALLRRMVNEGWLSGTVGLLAQGSPEPRLSAMIAATVKSELIGATDEHLGAWVREFRP
jgi:hypothetical protein